jgi:hypothetical protein
MLCATVLRDSANQDVRRDRYAAQCIPGTMLCLLDVRTIGHNNEEIVVAVRPRRAAGPAPEQQQELRAADSGDLRDDDGERRVGGRCQSNRAKGINRRRLPPVSFH